MQKSDMRFIDSILMVEEFHRIFKLDFKTKPDVADASMGMLRHRLMQEENDEYLAACTSGNLVEIADALGDQLYVLFGTIVTHGLQNKMIEIMEEIHRSNLSKLDENRQPIYREDGKILKSKHFFRPDLKKILEEKNEQ